MNKQPLIVNGWAIFADSCFLSQLEALQQKVQSLQAKYPKAWVKKDSAKRLAMIARLVLIDIPQDPTRDIYRQGGTLGSEHTSWFRAKFYQQYRLFFRYHLAHKVIVFGWVNDPSTKRAYDSKTDAYRVFQKMLEDGQPPTDWADLLLGAQAQSERFQKIFNNDSEFKAKD